MNKKGLVALFMAIVMVFAAAPVYSVGAGYGAADYTGAYYSSNGYDVNELLAKNGTALFDDLQELMTGTHTHITTYTELSEMIKHSDADPDVAGNILLCYSGASVNGDWDQGVTFNREHVWPKSLGGFDTSNAGADLHHIHPESPSVNSPRGNLLMSWVDTATKELAYNNQGIQSYIHSGERTFEPCDDFKGNTARIYFYVACRWGIPFADSTTPPVADTTLQTMLEWNLLDPVDAREEARNDYVQSVQGDRNVFVDYPEFGRLIYGDDANGFGYSPVTSGDYTYYVKNGNAVLTSYNGSAASVEIPSSIDGYTVTEIGCAAFANHPGLVSVSIPACVTKTGSYAFYNDGALTSVTVGSGAKTFERRAFRSCPNLRAIYFNGQAPVFHDEGADQIMISGADNGTAPNGLKLYYVDGQSGWTAGSWNSGKYSYTTALWDGVTEPSIEPIVTDEPVVTDEPTPAPTAAPGEGGYVLVTDAADITTGDYVIYGVNGGYSGAMNNTISSGKMGASSVAISGDKVVNPDASVIWHMERQEDGSFTLYNAAVGKYCMISGTSGSSTGFSLNTVASSGFNITAKEEGAGLWCIQSDRSDNDRMICLYQTDFRTYLLSNYKNTYLYKYTGETAEPTDTPAPTDTPEPTDTPAPTDTPEPGEGSYVLVTDAADITTGDYVLYGVSTVSGETFSGAMSSAISSGKMQASPVTVLSNTVVDPDASVIWHMEQQEDGSFTLYNAQSSQYCMITENNTSGFTVGIRPDAAFTAASASAKAENAWYLWTTAAGITRSISIYKTDFRAYNSSNYYPLYLYKYVQGAVPDPTPEPTDTPEPTVEPTQEPTPEPTAEPEVFEGRFEQISLVSEITEGDYVLYGENVTSAQTFEGAMSSLVSSGHMQAVPAVIEDGAVIDPYAISVWHIAPLGSDGAISLYNAAADAYCVINDDTTGSFALSESPTYGYTAELKNDEEGNFFLKSTCALTERGISIFENDFRPYKLANAKTLRLYKLVQSAPANLVGDVDCDGDVDFDDVSLLSAYLLNSNTVPITAQGLINADCNGDGKVDVLDMPAICGIAMSV
ncbi:MAG: endonuclease [Clostridia bacterium]|nr:endonuclease [Clostridia bacterium]